ncbi:polysaccharide pyruvyl transferase family protein [bacterium]|nr:polysaccharide pyruvyl transferase family protein [bacterium]
MRILYLKNETTNLGDAIQSLAAKYLIISSGNEPIPIEKEHIINRTIQAPSPLETESYLINGWFTKHEFNMLLESINGNTNGILAGIHISDWYDSKNINEKINTIKSELEIGCRDSGTYDQLIGIHTKAWTSGCLTTTLGLTFNFNAQKGKNDKDKVLFVDIQSCKCITREMETEEFTHSTGLNQTELEAEKTLNLFDDHSYIVTRRLHCALPACSMGKQVLFFGNIKDYRIEPVLLSGAKIAKYPSYRNENSLLLKLVYLLQRKVANLLRCKVVSDWMISLKQRKDEKPGANRILYSEIMDRIMRLKA